MNHFLSLTEHQQFTPGRVNIIGEHLDYNGGCVLPMALNIGIRLKAARNTLGAVRVHSDAFDDDIERGLDAKPLGHWSDHLMGAVQLAGDGKTGFDFEVLSDLPFGSGLSSSAALCVGVIKTVTSLLGGVISPVDAALMAQRVEHECIGVPCGIMDQMAVSVLQANQLMKLDTQSLAADLLSPPADWQFAVHHSGVVRALNEGRYATRREECERAATKLGLDVLCEAPANILENASMTKSLNEPELKRTRHVISENARVFEAVEAIQSNDARRFGELMNHSHISMRDDFEITTPEVDSVVARAIEAGALGARMTGGGFGGCIVSLVMREQFPEWKQKLAELAPSAQFIT